MMICGGYVCLVQYRRYQANPTVVSVERDFYGWNGTLPAFTFCYSDALHQDTADEFILNHWHVTEELDVARYQHYREFITLLVDATVFNFAGLLSYLDDPTLNGTDLDWIINALVRERDHYVSSFVKDEELMIPRPILTETGICYTVNSRQLKSLRDEDETETTTALDSPIECNFLQEQCFMKLDVFGSNVSLAIHSFYEPIRYETFFYELGHDDEIVATFRLLQTVNDAAVRELTHAQRKCLYYEEEMNLDSTPDQRNSGASVVDGFPFYSLNLCLLKCRAEKALSLCGCRPHFYPFFGEFIVQG